MSDAQARIDEAYTDVQATGRAAKGAAASAASARHSADLAAEVSDTANEAAETALKRYDGLVQQAAEQALAEQTSAGDTHCVAVEKDVDVGIRAHRLPNIGAFTATYGVAHCGYLAEHLTVVPDMPWDEVDIASRCEHCEPPPTEASHSLG